jgi:hypothetical protein
MKAADILIIPNEFWKEGLVTCGPKTSELLRIELDRLRAENERMKGALQRISESTMSMFLNKDSAMIWMITTAQAALPKETP